jgi:hypothetical protein
LEVQVLLHARDVGIGEVGAVELRGVRRLWEGTSHRGREAEADATYIVDKVAHAAKGHDEEVNLLDQQALARPIVGAEVLANL